MAVQTGVKTENGCRSAVDATSGVIEVPPADIEGDVMCWVWLVERRHA